MGAAVAGSVASLAANVAVAEPTLIGRVIAAWPSFALTASYELLTRQVRRSSAPVASPVGQPQRPRPVTTPAAKPAPAAELRLVCPPELGKGNRTPGVDLQHRAWRWALANRASDGSLPSGSAIGAAHGRQERWGRLIKKAGQAGAFGPPAVAETDAPHGYSGEAAAAGSEGGR